MEKKNEPKLYHIEEMEEYLNSILPDSSNSFKYLYLKKQIMAHFSLARNGYTNRISSYTEAKREALDKLCCKIAEEYGTTEKTWAQLAKENDINISTVQHYIKKYDQEHPGYFSQKPNRINEHEIIEMYFEKKYTANEIAEKLGCSASTVWRAIRSYRNIHKELETDCSLTRNFLNKEDIEIACAYLNTNSTYKEVAAKYSCSISTIQYCIKKYKAATAKMEEISPTVDNSNFVRLYFVKNVSIEQLTAYGKYSREDIENGIKEYLSELCKKYTADELIAEQIIEDYINGEKAHSLAKKYHKATTTVTEIIELYKNSTQKEPG